MEVLVFKTNIRYRKELSVLEEHLQTHAGIVNWNVDLKDCDKVLRVVGKNIQPVTIENMVQKLGYVCEELRD